MQASLTLKREGTLRRNTGFSALLLLLLVAALAAGCDMSFGIYRSIVEEKPQVGADLFKNVTVEGFAEDVTYYYASLAKVFRRAKTGGTWEQFSIDNDQNYERAMIASDGSRLHAALSYSDGSFRILYTDDSGAHWTDLEATSHGLPSSGSLQWMDVANGTLFVALRQGTDWTLYFWDGAAFQISINPGQKPLLGIVWSGSEYMALTAGSVYRGSADAMVEDTATGAPAGDGTVVLRNIFAHGGKTYVSTSDGHVYINDGSTWSSFEFRASTDLGPLCYLSLPSATPRLLVAKRSATPFGYMEYDLDHAVRKENGSDYISTSSSVYLSTVSGKIVRKFWISADGKVMFILLAAGGTDSYALYRNTYNETSSTWSGWSAE
ncbi:MAG: hypothetical protein WHT81_07915 [Rectinemataceae bacterium]